jgi:hypothetical protein
MLAGGQGYTRPRPFLSKQQQPLESGSSVTAFSFILIGLIVPELLLFYEMQ